MPDKSNRLKNLPPYVFAVIGDQIRDMQNAGIKVYRLDIGNPDMPPPDHVINSLNQSAHNPNNHGYSGYRGIPAFRNAVGRYYKSRFGVTVDPDTQILPLLGSKEGIINLTLAYVDEGDSVLVPDIGYPSYAMGTRLANGNVVWMPMRPENNFLPDFSQIASGDAQNSKLMWLNYPNNPTGATADIDFYKKAVSFCKEHDILLASDNPYADITFDGYRAESALIADPKLETTIELLSLSKSHNMAGWRLGAAVGSAKAIEDLLHVKSNIDSGHFKAIYEAAATALDETPSSWMQDRNEIYRRRRDLIMSALPEIGLSARKSLASLYIWAKVNDGDVENYIKSALADAHVSLAPGGAYGPGGEGYIRLSVGVPDEELKDALGRLKTWYAQHINKAGIS